MAAKSAEPAAGDEAPSAQAGTPRNRTPEAEAGGGPEFFTLFEDDADAPEEEAEDVFVQRTRSASQSSGAPDRAPTDAPGTSASKMLRIHILLAVCGLVLTATGSWFGLRAYARYELDQLEAKIQGLEEKHRRYLEAAGAGPSEAAAAGTAGGQAEEGTCRTRAGAAGRCVDDAAGVAGAVEAAPASAQSPAAADAPPPRGAAPAAPARAAEGPEAQPGAAAGEATDAAELPKFGAAPAEGDGQYPDLTCAKNVHTEWHIFKELLRSNIDTWLVSDVSRSSRSAHLQSLLGVAGDTLQSVYYNVEECGMGRLCMSLLGIASGEAGGSVLGAPSLHSPLLTLLLDVPWYLLMQSGWPFFGLLAQVHLQSHKLEDVPKKGREAAYFQELGTALAQKDAGKLAAAGAEFLFHKDEISNTLSVLCALASQLLELSPTEQQAGDVLTQLQVFFKQAVRNVEDLQVTLDSAWPLYGLLHAASKVSQAAPGAAAAGSALRPAVPAR